MPSVRFKHFCDQLAKAWQRPRWRAAVWALAALLLWCDGLGGLLKQSMLTHMGVQLTLLVLAGVGLGRALVAHWPRLRTGAARYRWAGVLLAAFTLMLWMLPRLLDVAVQNPVVDALKAGSLVLCAGVPLAGCWPALPAVARGVLHVEALATLWRLAWLYLDSPTRLCLQYGLDDQQRLGQGLLLAGLCYALWLLCLALGGRGVPSQRLHSTQAPALRL